MEKKINVLIAGQSNSICNYLIGLLGVRYKELTFLSGVTINQVTAHVEKQPIQITIFESKFLKTFSNIEEIEKQAKAFQNSLVILLQSKDTKEKQMQWLTKIFPNAIILYKPLNPAALFHRIDNFLESLVPKNGKETLSLPTWALHPYLNLEVLCQNYQNNREKVVKILKLYLLQIETQFQRIEQMLKENNCQKINEEFISLRTAFLYFADKKILQELDQIKNELENATERKLLERKIKEAKKIWESIKLEIEEL